MAFYNRRLVRLARRKIKAGCYGDRNANWRLLVGGFVPDKGLFKLLAQGLFIWVRAEVRSCFL